MADLKIPANVMKNRDGGPVIFTASKELTSDERLAKCAIRNGLEGSDAVLIDQKREKSWLGGDKSIFTYVCTEGQS